MPDIKRPRAVDQKDPRFFSLRTAQVRAIKTASQEGDKYYIEGIASSTVEDSYGDILTEACQVSMLGQCKGMTSWLNHSYDVPEDIVGTIVEATLLTGTAGDGTGRDGEGDGTCIDLYIKVEIDPANPRAMKAWNHVNNGTRLAFSIGGWFTDVEIVDNDSMWGWGFLVDDIELLEVSLVGLPANPRAYTKALETITEKLRALVVQKAEEIAKGCSCAAKHDGACPSPRILSELSETERKTTQRDAAAFVVKSVFADPPESEEVECVECAASLETDGKKCEKHATLDVGAHGAGEHEGGDALAAPATPDPAPAAAAADPVGDHPAPVSLTIELTADFDFAAFRAAFDDALAKALDVNVVDQEGRLIATFSGAEPDETRELSDMQTQACISAMRSIKEAVDHGMCTQAEGSARTAHAVIKAMLPDDYDVPEDAQLADAGESAQSALDVKLAELQTQLEEATAKLTQMSAERDTLAQQVEKLKASPAGRLTRSSISGGSSNDEPTAPADLYYKPQSELAATAAAASGSADTRARMQRI